MENYKCPVLSVQQANVDSPGEYKPVNIYPISVHVGNGSSALPLAHFIVRACNAHEGLVKALEELSNCVLCGFTDSMTTRSANRAAAILEALALAKGEMR